MMCDIAQSGTLPQLFFTHFAKVVIYKVGPVNPLLHSVVLYIDTILLIYSGKMLEKTSVEECHF